MMEMEKMSTIAQDLLAAWQQAHGTRHGKAHSMAGPEGVVIFIEDAFSQAELKLTEQQSGCELLRRYAKGLLEQVCREQATHIAAVSGRSVIATGVSIDPQEGWLICFFRLRSLPHDA